MRRSLSFRTRTLCTSTGVLLDVLVIYFGQTTIDMAVVDDEIQNALKVKDPIPDVLYVIGHGKQGKDIARIWENNYIRTANLLARGRSDSINYLKQFSIFEFENGCFKPVLASPTNPTYALDIGSLLQDGLSQLVFSKGAYQIAPTGHVFKHPSGKRSRHFFLTSELLADEIDAYFVALCICTCAYKEISVAPRIYIDTMGIYPIARAVRDIAFPFPNATGLLEICSFHSHGGLENFQPSDANSAVVLISASTSGNMASAMGKEKGFPASNVITILDLDRENRHGLVVYDHKNESIRTESPSSLQVEGHETPIELVGEYFAARGKRPRALTLSLDHAPKSLKPTLNDFFENQCCVLQAKRQHGSGSIDSISVSQKAIVQSEEFGRWLTEELRLRTPASISHILASLGNDSLDLAQKCAAELETITGKTPMVLSSSEIENLKIEGATGVLVCSVIVGNGHSLRVTARDIRELAPNASRHFIVGLGLPDTSESWSRLRQFLTQSGDSARPYLFGCWRQLPIGSRPPRDTWSSYAKLLQKLEHISVETGEQSPWNTKNLDGALKAAMSALENSMDSLLPAGDLTPLCLSEGFVYWRASAEQLETANHHALSYLAMASVLQCAREFENPLKRLRSTLYETVVLDPENFLRFNDGVLQASLLRAANSFELDYSMSPEHSQSMKEILEKIFLNHSKKYGQAALEFSAALASGHLKLTDTDFLSLIDSVASNLSTNSNPIAGLLFYVWANLLKNQKLKITVNAASPPD